MFQVKEDEMLLSGLAGISPLSLSFLCILFFISEKFLGEGCRKKEEEKIDRRQ